LDLLDALRRPEGKTLEFKRDISSPEGLLRTVVAFANTAGGVVLVGVEDRSRHVRGVADPFDLEERIASLITDSIAPRLLPDLEVLAWRKTHVVAGSDGGGRSAHPAAAARGGAVSDPPAWLPPERRGRSGLTQPTGCGVSIDRVT
jgi:hypothetical protein